MTASDSSAVAAQLHEWFDSILHLTDESLFGVMPEGPHRDAVVLDTLKRNARILSQSDLDKDGKLYSALCFFLSAACRKLGITLSAGHWRAALKNVLVLHHQRVNKLAESDSFGLDFGSPAIRFKLELDEAIRQSGLASEISYLDKENREVALGLSINWGMRFLIAYALECIYVNGSAGRKDLAWVASAVKPLV
jgi:hypothetical protein